MFHKTVEGFIKLRVDEATSTIMIQLDELVACKRKTDKVASKDSLSDIVCTTNT